MGNWIAKHGAMPNPIRFLSQGHAEDVLLRHRFRYYVLGCPVITDQEYDALERMVRERWEVGVVVQQVASDQLLDYPAYIQEGRWPNEEERRLRDSVIVARWMDSL